MNLREIVRHKKEEIIRIAERYHARNVRLFGSVARGDADEKSDIDLLVEPMEGFTLFTHAGMIDELEALLGTKVDVISDRGLRERIRDRVLREVVPL